MKRALENLTEIVKVTSVPTAAGMAPVKQESEVNGVDISRIPARDVYSFGLQLLEAIFTRKELAESLLFKSKKSSKPGLPAKKVQQ